MAGKGRDGSEPVPRGSEAKMYYHIARSSVTISMSSMATEAVTKVETRCELPSPRSDAPRVANLFPGTGIQLCGLHCTASK